jgi:hypothetical protein
VQGLNATPVNDEEEKDETARPAMKEEVRPQRAEEEEDPELEAESRTRDVELDEAPSDKAPMEVQSAIAISHSSNSNKRSLTNSSFRLLKHQLPCFPEISFLALFDPFQVYLKARIFVRFGS